MTDALSHVTTWAYNISGNQDTITDAANTTHNTNNVTTYIKDAFGRTTQVTDPSGHSTAHAYDRDSNFTSTTDRDGRPIDYTYDNLNRETGEIWYTSTARTTTSETLSYSYDAANNLLTANITDGTNAYNYTMTYDKQNRVATAAEPFGASGCRS
jgi:YD repeat-containing protein